MNFSYELMMGKIVGLFSILVVWSVSYASAKTWKVRGASNHSAFMGKWPTVISLIHPQDELSFKEMRMWGYSKISSCCICDWYKFKRNGRQGESKVTNTNGGKLPCRPSSSYKKLLDRVTFWIVYIAWRVGYKIAAYSATSVGVGRKNRLFCVCVTETVLLLLLSISLCILLW